MGKNILYTDIYAKIGIAQRLYYHRTASVLYPSPFTFWSPREITPPSPPSSISPSRLRSSSPHSLRRCVAVADDVCRRQVRDALGAIPSVTDMQACITRQTTAAATAWRDGNGNADGDDDGYLVSADKTPTVREDLDSRHELAYPLLRWLLSA